MSHDSGAVASPDVRRLQAELQFVTELCEVVASNSEMRPILDWVVRKTIDMLSADDGSIKLLPPEVPPPHAGPPEVPGVPVTLIRSQSPGLSSGSWPRAASRLVMGFLQVRGEALITPDLDCDPRFPGLGRDGSHVRAVLAVPLKVGNRITGMLAVTEARPGRQWTARDAQLLAIVAANSAGVIEQAQLRVEAVEKQRFEEKTRLMERDLERARQTQMRLVPDGPIVVGPWQAEGRVVPALLVGGDAYDYRELGEGRLAIAIADVSGKGPEAALLMANMQGVLRVFCDGRRPIREAIRFVNENVAPSCSGGKFITLFYGEIDPAAGRLSFVNAGHNYPMLRRRDGRVEELLNGGLPLGVLESTDYEQGVAEFRPGDSLLLYSDGVPDALDAVRAEFGEDRLRALWCEHGARPPREVVDLLFERIAAFRGPADQNDDMTVVVVGQAPKERRPGGPVAPR